MAKRLGKRKCLNCGVFFIADHRNQQRQRYCSKPECRKASKAASQKLWLQKPGNRDYFRGLDNVRRVQQWRKDHPGYARKKRQPLQDRLSENSMEDHVVKPTLPGTALQDLLSLQPTVLIGLIAHLTGSALQDDIALSARRLQQLGSDILNGPTHNNGGTHDPKASYPSGALAPTTQTVQLGGPSPGA
jgi:ribosomal protein S27AE